MPTWLVILLGYLGKGLAGAFGNPSTPTPATPSTSTSAAKSAVTSSSLNLGVDLAPAVTAVAGTVTEAGKVAEAIIADENTPAMIAGRENRNEQEAKDRIVNDTDKALKTGDVKAIERDLS